MKPFLITIIHMISGPICFVFAGLLALQGSWWTLLFAVLGILESVPNIKWTETKSGEGKQ